MLREGGLSFREIGLQFGFTVERARGTSDLEQLN